MSIPALIFYEIIRRPVHALCAVFVLFLSAFTVYSSYPLLKAVERSTAERLETLQTESDTLLAGLDDSTRKIMLNIGFNLLIVHQDTDMSDLWANDYAEQTMPQEYVQRLSESKELTLIAHIVATLQGKIKLDGRTTLVKGIMPEVPQAHLKKQKKPMVTPIESGTVVLGYELGHSRKVGDTITIEGKEFKIVQIEIEQGGKEDITISMNLADAQELLNQPDRINQILALGCRCAGERLPKIRAQLETVLPDTKITEHRSIALARAEQRDLVSFNRKQLYESTMNNRKELENNLKQWIQFVLPCMIVVGTIFLCITIYDNIRKRKKELGLLRSIGFNNRQISILILGKWFSIGVIGTLLACGIAPMIHQRLLNQLGENSADFLISFDWEWAIVTVCVCLLMTLVCVVPFLVQLCKSEPMNILTTDSLQ